MRKFVILITFISLLIIIIALFNSARRSDGVLTKENTIVLPDEPEAAKITTEITPESTIIQDYVITNADEYITLKTWGPNFTEQEKKDDMISVFTYANNIAVQYNVTTGEEDVLKRLNEIIKQDKKSKKDYDYTVVSVYENKNTVWATTEFEKEKEKGGSVIFVRQLNSNIVTGNISYFIDYPQVTYIAKPELIDMFVKACGLTGGATINLESPDYSIYKVENIPVTAYSWQENQVVEARSNEMLESSFRSGAKGVNESVDIWKGNKNAYKEVKNYLVSAMQHSGIWFSQIDDNENFSYVILHYNIVDDEYDTVIYLVENEGNHYKTVVITAEKDCDLKCLNDIMEVYHIEDRPTIYSLDELAKISSVFKEKTDSVINILSDEERAKIEIPEYSILLTREKIQTDFKRNEKARKKDIIKKTLLGQLIIKTYDMPKLTTPVRETIKMGWNGYKESEMKMKVKSKK